MTSGSPVVKSFISSSMASRPKSFEALPTKQLRRGASSTKSTPPLAAWTLARVMGAVVPTYSATRSARWTSTKARPGITPRSNKSSATNLAMLVLPLPGLPWKTMCSMSSPITGAFSSRLRRLMTMSLRRLRNFSLIGSRPTMRANLPSSTSSDDGAGPSAAAARRGPTLRSSRNKPAPSYVTCGGIFRARGNISPSKLCT
mmetsp:Transcript_32523/g.83616  ORF Transcript_32523/g.83616 Transcript_32523/m.83616 type:complete len:201 (+) Transcript_32523:90-692(+)